MASVTRSWRAAFSQFSLVMVGWRASWMMPSGSRLARRHRWPGVAPQRGQVMVSASAGGRCGLLP